MLGRASSVISHDPDQVPQSLSPEAPAPENADARRAAGGHPAKLTRTKSLPASQRHVLDQDDADHDEGAGANARETATKSRLVPSIIAALRPTGSKDLSENVASQAKKLAQQEQAEHYEAIMKRFQLRKVPAQPSRGSGAFSATVTQLMAAQAAANTARVRIAVVVVVIAIQIIYLPLIPAYFENDSKVATPLQLLFEWVFFIDCLLTFNTVVRDQNGDLLTSRHDIAEQYLRGWFFLDALGSVPFDTIMYISTRKTVVQTSKETFLLADMLARIPRLYHYSVALRAMWATSRLFRGGGGYWAWILFYSRYSHLLRITGLVFLVILAAHYMSCLWHTLDKAADRVESPSRGFIETYVANYFYAILLIHGQGVSTDTYSQTVLSVFVVLVGSFILAIVFGNVAMLVSNFNANTTNFQRRMEGIFATMDKMQLPVELQERIQQYFAHLWQQYESLNDDLVGFSKELTPTLALEVGLFQYMHLIVKIPHWTHCSPDFVTQIVLKLVVRVYLPDDYILRQGEMSQNLFMINRGVCERHRDNAKSAVGDEKLAAESNGRIDSQSFSRRKRFSIGMRTASLAKVIDASMGRVAYPKVRPVEYIHPGQSFGEMALLMNHEQRISIRAAAYVEMCVLSRAEFQAILLRFQDDRPVVLTSLLQHAIERDELPFSLETVYGISLHSSTGAVESSLASEQSQLSGRQMQVMTSRQAAEFLVARINRDVLDSSIEFGFQTLERDVRARQMMSSRATSRSIRHAESPEAKASSRSSNHGASALPGPVTPSIRQRNEQDTLPMPARTPDAKQPDDTTTQQDGHRGPKTLQPMLTR
ncbi:hypothetical protein ATCC90586_000989 [Pythium insidiosum]|nr:hypothetical protein ATCC90586_000989 [Pythium insidiosum]